MKREDQKSVTVGTLSYDAMWAQIKREATAPRLREPQGDGWKTTMQLRKEWGTGKGKTLEHIKGLIASGGLEVFRGDKVGASGRTGRQVWYRPRVAGVAK